MNFELQLVIREIKNNDAIFYTFLLLFYPSMNEHDIKRTSKFDINLFWEENIIALLLSLCSFGVYWLTMSRSVGLTDSGELAAVLCTLGIAHPTGYPLFTLLGRCWIMLPIPTEEIIRLNIFSALLTATSVGIFFKLALTVCRSKALFNLKFRQKNPIDDKHKIFITAISSLILGFSTTFWSQSCNIEVYSLHLVLLLMSLWMFIKGIEEQLEESKYVSNKLILFSFVLGLGFSNHMTTILLLPAFIWLFIFTFGWTKKTLNLIMKLFIFFFIGLSIYIYLPIRSSCNPLFDWGHPATLERFFWHVSGKQYSVWMFSGWSVVKKQLNYYLSNFTSEFFVLTIPFLIFGVFQVLKRSVNLYVFLVILFLTTILYSVNYDIIDIDSYFLLSYIVVTLLLFFGLLQFMGWVLKKERWIKALAILIVCTIPALQIISNFDKCDESESKLPQQVVEKVFLDLEPNAVVFATQWVYFISPSWYYQFVRHQRKDVTIIDKSLLQNRSWYFFQLERQAKWLMDRVKHSSDLFLIELSKFERGIPFNYNVIYARWQNLLIDIVEKSLVDRPVYIDINSNVDFPAEYVRTPAGLFLRLSKDKNSAYYKTALHKFSIWKTYNPAIRNFEINYIGALLNEATWLIQSDRKDEAEVVLKEVLRIEPSNYTAIALRRKIAGMNN